MNYTQPTARVVMELGVSSALLVHLMILFTCLSRRTRHSGKRFRRADRARTCQPFLSKLGEYSLIVRLSCSYPGCEPRGPGRMISRESRFRTTAQVKR